ncbi:MAG: HNH endonuclease [Deltaproteobacteria bacterium RIFCSPLOWO2_12_FULL_60_19]|nr:MAG: HNH endonuclease [Deltaproteobacteria bacterium RIFCSPLOWO2_12_FULL_60_19]
MDAVPFLVTVSDEEIRRERNKARELRAGQWWKRRCSAGLCHYCGKKVPARALTMDHVVPIIRGGKSAKGNVVPACKECNTKKKHSLPMEWEEYK